MTCGRARHLGLGWGLGACVCAWFYFSPGIFFNTVDFLDFPQLHYMFCDFHSLLRCFLTFGKNPRRKIQQCARSHSSPPRALAGAGAFIFSTGGVRNAAPGGWVSSAPDWVVILVVLVKNDINIVNQIVIIFIIISVGSALELITARRPRARGNP